MTDHQENDNDFVLVPRIPTQRMLKAAWAEANEENAAGVWREMIEAWESAFKQMKVS